MDTHHIHGTEVGFHSDAKEASDFLKTGVHSHIAQGYLQTAKEQGESHFINEKGEKFKIIHEEKDGKDSFSVERSHH